MIIFICIFAIIPVLSVTSFADIGLKRSITINFIGFEDRCYYVTILSDESSNGPLSYEDSYDGVDVDIHNSFLTVDDEFYYLGYFNELYGNDDFKWSYFPPDNFKILIYFPDVDQFLLIPDVYSQYAFSSHYTVTFEGDTASDNVTYDLSDISVKRSYNYLSEILGFIFRVICTVVIEILIALFFRFRGKDQLRQVFKINVITQIAFNLLLNIWVFYFGPMLSSYGLYFICEFVIFVVEAKYYVKNIREPYMNTHDLKPWDRGPRVWLYSFVANVASFAFGYYFGVIAQR